MSVQQAAQLEYTLTHGILWFTTFVNGFSILNCEIMPVNNAFFCDMRRCNLLFVWFCTRKGTKTMTVEIEFINFSYNKILHHRFYFWVAWNNSPINWALKDAFPRREKPQAFMLGFQISSFFVPQPPRFFLNYYR